MVKLLYILIAFLILGIIIVVHEFGHYLVGRLCGIGVLEFSVGFGPRLFGFKRGEIDYSLRCIPLGGFCKFLGEDSDNPDPRAINNCKPWKRFLTIFAGPFMNFVLAFVFCVVLLCNYMVFEYQPRISYVTPDSAAAESELQVGDILTEVNGETLSYDQTGVNRAAALIRASADQPVELTVLRKNESLRLTILPRPFTDETSGETSWQIGISFGGRTFRFGEGVRYGLSFMVQITGEMLDSLKNLVFKGEGVNDMMGPVGIISYVSDIVYSERMYAVVYMLFLLSLNIGIMNLLPLPALDGGRLIFVILEAIRRKPVPAEKEGLVHMIGFVLLLLLILFITYKDILRLITGG